jgi:hypothetical protein
MIKRLPDQIKMRNFAHTCKRSWTHQFIKHLFRHGDSVVKIALKCIFSDMKILFHVPLPSAETIACRAYMVTVDAHVAECIHILKTKVDGLF